MTGARKMLLLLFVVLMNFSCISQKRSVHRSNDLLSTYNSLKAQLPDANIKMNGDQIQVIMAEAYMFSANSATINQAVENDFAVMAGIFNQYPKTDILINGYTDASGSADHNSELSKNRADAAEHLLVSNKVKASRIYSWGRGERDPVGDNRTEQGRRKNRRVEIIIVYDYNHSQKK